MKPHAAIPLLLMFTIAGCHSFGLSAKHGVANAQETGLRFILFYDSYANHPAQDDYYDALLAIVQKYSVDHQRILIPACDGDAVEKFKLRQCPALIVKNNGETMVRIEGSADEQSIIKQISEVMNHTKAN